MLKGFILFIVFMIGCSGQPQNSKINVKTNSPLISSTYWSRLWIKTCYQPAQANGLLRLLDSKDKGLSAEHAKADLDKEIVESYERLLEELKFTNKEILGQFTILSTNNNHNPHSLLLKNGKPLWAGGKITPLYDKHKLVGFYLRHIPMSGYFYVAEVPVTLASIMTILPHGQIFFDDKIGLAIARGQNSNLAIEGNDYVFDINDDGCSEFFTTKPKLLDSQYLSTLNGSKIEEITMHSITKAGYINSLLTFKLPVGVSSANLTFKLDRKSKTLNIYIWDNFLFYKIAQNSRTQKWELKQSPKTRFRKFIYENYHRIFPQEESFNDEPETQN